MRSVLSTLAVLALPAFVPGLAGDVAQPLATDGDGAPQAIRQPAPPASSSYLMERLCVSSTGGSAASASYETAIVLADGAVQGLAASCNSGMQAAIGLCSLARDLTAPIVLKLDKLPADPDGVALTWSGAEPTYEAFRSLSGVDVVDPLNSFAVTSGCAVEDPTAGADSLVFYRVTTPRP